MNCGKSFYRFIIICAATLTLAACGGGGGGGQEESPLPAPVAVANAASTAAATAVTIPVLANDTIAAPGVINTASVTISTQSPDGTAVANPDGTVTFTPAAGFSGTTTFTYTVTNTSTPALASNAATVTVTVAPGAQTWFFAEGAGLTDAQMTSFDNQLLYFNVHSAANPVGEIRGVIIPSTPAFLTDNGDPVTNNNFSTLLSGDQEVPATTTQASGYATVVLDPATRTLTGVVVTNGIVGIAAHIHEGAPGVAGPVIFPLQGGPTVWTVPAGTVLTDAQVATLAAGTYYVNVHSTAAPSGEIRGQLTQQLRFAALSGANEVPPNASTATGTGVLSLNPVTNEIRGFVKTTGITGTVAHIHEGLPGVIGPVSVPLTETPVGSGLWVVPDGSILTAGQVASFNAGNLYFNVHSAANPVGEIRGHILAATVKVGNASLDGAQETPAVTTSASGTGIITLNSVTRQVQGNVQNTGIAGTVAHVHEGPAGVIGPVIVPLTLTPPPSTLTQTILFATQVQPILTANCVTACHGPTGIAAFLNLETGSSFAALVQSASPAVVPGSSATSRLFLRISTNTPLQQMPLLAAPLSAADQTLIKDWIDQGAANN